ncbi:aspartic peptidase A1 [Melampsora larici-populina 98AG31]|uniref:Aspartic peptidase A1 n=1 Tax=Melampsora larici-populina (strain 98AG31 / pathotype 3-4-7) TaxID=747676 RepID=F4R7G6_MELLP|nr:aspartic peptidase A1 [Melampsora larici-populina 98AG31]EGG11789.1 aspartic peptidase A1 [Melampsora larici-populina 98AG31]
MQWIHVIPAVLVMSTILNVQAGRFSVPESVSASEDQSSTGLIDINIEVLDRASKASTPARSYQSNPVESYSAIAKEIYQRDRNRAHHLKIPADQQTQISQAAGDPGQGPGSTVVATNAVVSYLADIKVGSHGQSFKLIIDTGSSNTWVGSGTRLENSESTIPTGSTFSVSYGSGSAWGTEVLEKVSVSSTISVNQSIGIASESFGFNDVDGILGLGPSKLTVGTQTEPKKQIPTIMDTLFHAKKIARPVLGVFFAPSHNNSTRNGRLTFGGVQNSLFHGKMSWIPKTSTKPSSSYYGVNLTITASGKSIMPNKAGIVDTGTTLVLLPDDAFKRYVNMIPNAKILDDGLVMFPKSSIQHIPTLEFDFGIFKATLTSNQQVLPIDQAHYYGASTRMRYSYVSAMGTQSGTGLDFILGQKFLEHYYTAYDSQSGSVGIATATVIEGSSSTQRKC